MSHDREHNLQSLPLPERAALELESALETSRARWEEIRKGIERAPAEITTESEAEDFTTVVAQIQALLKRIDASHDDVKEPYLEAGRRVDSGTWVLRDKVQEAKRQLEERLSTYQVKKHEAIERQRAEERRREQEDPEPAFVPHREIDRRRTRIRSVEGASAHLVDVVHLEIVDVTKIPLRYLNRPKVRNALISEMLPDARKGDEIEGVKVHRGAQSRVKA